MSVDDPRCADCKSGRLERAGTSLWVCLRCGWMGRPVSIERYPRRPFRKTDRRVVKP